MQYIIYAYNIVTLNIINMFVFSEPNLKLTKKSNLNRVEYLKSSIPFYHQIKKNVQTCLCLELNILKLFDFLTFFFVIIYYQ